jgi:hypothetical protein
MVNLNSSPYCIENDIDYYLKYLSPTKKVKHMGKTKNKELKHKEESNHANFTLGFQTLKSEKNSNFYNN